MSRLGDGFGILDPGDDGRIDLRRLDFTGSHDDPFGGQFDADDPQWSEPTGHDAWCLCAECNGQKEADAQTANDPGPDVHDDDDGDY